MRKSELRRLLISAGVLCALGGSVEARPEQNGRVNAPGDVVEDRSPTKPGVGRPPKTVMARNTNPKAKSVAPAVATKPQPPQEKRTVGRYWKRLMIMVREANHAHRTKK